MKKIILYDGSGKQTQCIVFTGSKKKLQDAEMFSEIELEILKIQNPTIIQSEMYIHNDDNIRSIKKKILREFSETTYGYDEIYLHYGNIEKFESNSFYNEITQNGKIVLYRNTFAQIRMNCQIPIKDGEIRKSIYDEHDVNSLEIKECAFFKPVGIEFTDFTDYRFSSNPFDVLQTDEQVYQSKGNNILVSMDNKLLLNYGTPDIIHCCFAEQICNFAIENKMNEEYFIKNYYPQLYRKYIKNNDDLLKQRPLLLKVNKDILKPSSFEYYKNIHLLHEIQENKKKNLNYLSIGHKKVVFEILPVQELNLPVHSLFKILHASVEIPIIKYTFSTSSDKLLRIHTVISQKNGKPEPLLSKNIITNYSSKKHDSNTVSFFIQSKNGIIIADLYSSGLIKYRCDWNNILSMIEIEDELKVVTRPVVKMLNEILLQYNISISYFDVITNSNINITNIDYHKIISTFENIKLSACKPLIGSVFDITHNNQPIKLMYKRVDNYKKMDAMNKMINDIYEETNDESKVVDILKSNFNLSDKDAMEKISLFFSSFTRINNKFTKTINIAESPGFLCTINYDLINHKLFFEVSNINNIEYINFINIYTDSLFTLMLSKDDIDISKDIIDNACKQKIVEDITHLETVVTTSNIQSDIIQPLNFINKEEISDDESDDDLLFGSEDESEDGSEDESEDGSEDGSEDDEISGGGKEDILEKGHLLDGKSITRPNIFFKRLKEKEPSLFLTKKEGKFDAYSRICPSTMNRQPILLTDDEKKEIDKNYKGSYDQSVEYGSDPNNKFHYICPRYWCLLTNTSITEEQMKSGMCGKVIPKKSAVIPKGHYVYEFYDDRVHLNDKNKYKFANPSFLKDKTHPDGKCIPCCFGNSWKSKAQQERIKECTDATSPIKNKKKGIKDFIKSDKYNPYIIEFNTYPIPENRLGYLHPSFEKILGLDYNKVKDSNPHNLKSNKSTLLRIGSENNIHKSFLACIFNVYKDLKNIKYNVTLDTFIDTFINIITLDKFVQYNNGSLISVFHSNKISNLDIHAHKYSVLYNSLDLTKETDYFFLEKCVSSFHNYKKYISSKKSHVDHTYLWDVVTDESNPLLEQPFNLIIMEMLEDDITNNVNFLCPTSAYSTHIYNPAWNSILMIKRGMYYELVCSISTRSGPEPIIKTYFKLDSNDNISVIMKNIMNHTLSVCNPKKSIPTSLTEFVENIDASRIVNILKQFGYIIVNQIINYQSKVIGVEIKENEDIKTTLFVPTLPSSIMKGYTITTMDNIYWNDYETTFKRLTGVSQKTKKILCSPHNNVEQDGKIVGMITKTNQFIQVVPPIDSIDTNNGLVTIKDANFVLADIVLTSESTSNNERNEYVRNIRLENDFYNAFKNIIRNILIYPTNSKLLDKTKYFIQDPTVLFKYKLEKMKLIITKVIEDFIVFADYDKKILEQLESITNCVESENKHYCSAIPENGINKLIIPSENLNDNSISNEKLYIERISYDIIYNKNVQDYFFNTKFPVYIPDTFYNVDKNEIIIPSTLIPNITKTNNDFIIHAENSYITQNVFDNAIPEITQMYNNQIVRSSINIDDIDDKDINDCIEKYSTQLLGAPSLKWNTLLPSTSELLFGNVQECSYFICQYVYKLSFSVDIQIADVKNKLWLGYKKYLTKYNVAIDDILINEAKKPLINGIKKGTVSYFSMFMDNSDYYLSLLDFIIFANMTNIPILFIHNSNLTHLRLKNNMLFTGDVVDASKKYFIARIHNIDKKHKFSMLQGQFFLSDIANYKSIIDNYEHKTLEEILSSYTL
jgi:hypothetical protein